MKKIFYFLFLSFSLLPIFAYTYQSDSVLVKTTVSKITLSEAAISENGLSGLYKLYGGLESVSSASIDSLLAEDISSNDIIIYFRIAQLAKTRTDERISLSVKAERLENTNSEAVLLQDSKVLVYTEAPVISNVMCLSSDVLQVSSTIEDVNRVIFSLVYSLGKPVENVNLAFFTSTWSKTPGLAPGLYTSKITLSYITN